MARTKLHKPRTTRRKERSSQLGYEVRPSSEDSCGQWEFLGKLPDGNPTDEEGRSFCRVVIKDDINNLWHYYSIYTNYPVEALSALVAKSIPQLGVPELVVSLVPQEMGAIVFTATEPETDEHVFTAAICDPVIATRAVS